MSVSWCRKAYDKIQTEYVSEKKKYKTKLASNHYENLIYAITLKCEFA